ncbi:hypothetical protein D3C87_1828490 [compost metagenome]
MCWWWRKRPSRAALRFGDGIYCARRQPVRSHALKLRYGVFKRFQKVGVGVPALYQLGSDGFRLPGVVENPDVLPSNSWRFRFSNAAKSRNAVRGIS